MMMAGGICMEIIMGRLVWLTKNQKLISSGVLFQVVIIEVSDLQNHFFSELKINQILNIAKELGIVDWSNVAVDTPIFVRNSNEEVWKCRYFAMYEDGEVYAWQLGRTSWSNPIKHSPITWKYAKLVGDTDE